MAEAVTVVGRRQADDPVSRIECNVDDKFPCRFPLFRSEERDGKTGIGSRLELHCGCIPCADVGLPRDNEKIIGRYPVIIGKAGASHGIFGKRHTKRISSITGITGDFVRNCAAWYRIGHVAVGVRPR